MKIENFLANEIHKIFSKMSGWMSIGLKTGVIIDKIWTKSKWSGGKTRESISQGITSCNGLTRDSQIINSIIYINIKKNLMNSLRSI